jgi:hypothetical protein
MNMLMPHDPLREIDPLTEQVFATTNGGGRDKPDPGQRAPLRRAGIMDAWLDPYGELGVPRTASNADITDAYRHLVRQHHSVSGPPAARAAECDASLIRIMEAYTILDDPNRRERYDRQHPEASARPPQHRPAYLTWIGPIPPESLTVIPAGWH